MMIFLSGPIDKLYREDDIKAEVIEYLHRSMIKDLIVFCPHVAFLRYPGDLNDAAGLSIVKVCRKALAIADAMLLCYVPGVETWGSSYELYLAHKWGKPMAVFTHHPEAIHESIYLSVHVGTSPVYTDMQGVYDWIRSLMPGKGEG